MVSITHSSNSLIVVASHFERETGLIARWSAAPAACFRSAPVAHAQRGNHDAGLARAEVPPRCSTQDPCRQRRQSLTSGTFWSLMDSEKCPMTGRAA